MYSLRLENNETIDNLDVNTSLLEHGLLVFKNTDKITKYFVTQAYDAINNQAYNIVTIGSNKYKCSVLDQNQQEVDIANIGLSFCALKIGGRNGKNVKCNRKSGGIGEEYSLELAKFPMSTNYITLPQNIILYRSSRTPANRTTDVRFFSEYNIAQIYEDITTHNYVYEYKLITPTNLLDIRYLKYMMLELILNTRDLQFILNRNPETAGDYGKALAYVPITDTTKVRHVVGKELLDFRKPKHVAYVNAFLFAFGLVPSTDQHTIYKDTFGVLSELPNITRPEPFNHIGYRWSTMELDDLAVQLFKVNFEHIIDGYVAPIFNTHYHDGMFHQEICIFNPSKSLGNITPNVVIGCPYKQTLTLDSIVTAKPIITNKFRAVCYAGGGSKCQTEYNFTPKRDAKGNIAMDYGDLDDVTSSTGGFARKKKQKQKRNKYTFFNQHAGDIMSRIETTEFGIFTHQGLDLFKSGQYVPTTSSSKFKLTKSDVLGYENEGVSKCVTSETRLMDIRILRHLVQELLLMMAEAGPVTHINFQEVEAFKFVFGLIPYADQLQKASPNTLQAFHKTVVSHMNQFQSILNQVSDMPGYDFTFPKDLRYIFRYGSRVYMMNDLEFQAHTVFSKVLDDYVSGYFTGTWHTPWEDSYPRYVYLFKPSNVIEKCKLPQYAGRKKVLQKGSGLDDDIAKEKHIGKIWEDLERTIEDELEIQCSVSNNEKLRSFMTNILVKLTQLLHDMQQIRLGIFTKDDEQYEKLINLIRIAYKPNIKVKSNTIGKSISYILKPGFYDVCGNRINGLIKNDVRVVKGISLSQMMGAVYGTISDSGIISNLLKAVFFDKPLTKRVDQNLFDQHRNMFNAKYPHLKALVTEAVESLKKLFDLPNTFGSNELITLLDENDITETHDSLYGTGMKFVKGGDNSIVLDLLVYNPKKNRYSLVRRHLQNRSYIRRNRATDDYERSINVPSCPKFININRETQEISDFKLVEGSQWYELKEDSVFTKLMRRYKRTSRTGPSGSTLLWLNMAFNILALDKEKKSNYDLMLLCIIADFVPVYHSLTEVIMIFAKECPFVTNPYTLDQNPVKWLAEYLVQDVNDLVRNPSSSEDFQKGLNEFINKTFDTNT